MSGYVPGYVPGYVLATISRFCRRPGPATLVLGTSLACGGCALADTPGSPSYTQTVMAIQQQVEQGRLSDANAALTAALTRFPHDGGLENLAGVVAAQGGQPARARLLFQQAVQHAPHLTAGWLNLARVDMASAEQDSAAAAEALRCDTRVLRTDPHNTEALYGAATLELWRKNYAASLASIGQLGAAPQGVARVQAVRCAAQAALGERAATTATADAMAANEQLEEGDVLLAMPALRAAHRADLLVLLLQAVAQRHGLSPAAQRLLGLAQEADGQRAQALTTLAGAYQADPANAALLRDMARIALAGGDTTAALGYLAHARALAPGDASLAYDYGYVCMQMHLTGEAQKAFGAAVQLSPEDADDNFAMGMATGGAGAVPYLKTYLRLRPSDAAGELALGEALLENNDLAGAKPWLTRAAAQPRTAAEAHYALGRLLVQQSSYADAITELRMAVAAQPAQADAWAELGEAYLRLRQWKPAEENTDHAIALDPGNYTANYTLLRLYGETNDARRAGQAQRFAALRSAGEEQYRASMRAIEAKPVPLLATQQQ